MIRDTFNIFTSFLNLTYVYRKLRSSLCFIVKWSIPNTLSVRWEELGGREAEKCNFPLVLWLLSGIQWQVTENYHFINRECFPTWRYSSFQCNVALGIWRSTESWVLYLVWIHNWIFYFVKRIRVLQCLHNSLSSCADSRDDLLKACSSSPSHQAPPLSLAFWTPVLNLLQWSGRPHGLWPLASILT